LRMALAFQLGISLIAIVRTRWGMPGLYVGATVLGLTDVDALTVSTAQSGIMPSVAAQAIMLGITANTVLKSTMSVVLGHPKLWRLTLATLLAMSVGNVLVLTLWWRT
jgi:uncharacterized membrane protein (DUF4010 family)